MLSQKSQMDENHLHLNSNHDPLNDHDYCSPNKNSIRKQQTDKSDNSLKSNNKMATSVSNNLKDSVTASTSSSPDAKKIGSRGDNFSLPTIDCDSSSSSSSLSCSVASSRELVIAQDQELSSPQGKPVSQKRKPGRPRLNPEANSSVYHIPPQARTKRPRQSTSVTDKSEWIMGDDQIDSVLSEHLNEEPREKRHKPKEQDSAFTEQFSSSDYSASDAESEAGSEYNSEDDPERLWCICQKPHGGKFMINCDICKEWYHGHCVGVTKLMGDRFEKQGKEWFCGECQEKLRAGSQRNAIPSRLARRERKVKKTSVPGKRGRGRPRKSESLGGGEQVTRTSLRSSRKSTSSLDPKLGVDNGKLRKNLARSETRSESFDSSYDDSRRLKELIKERKKDFFLKRRLQEQQKAAKRNELGLGRPTLTGNLSNSLDSLANTTNTPNMNNLPINIKSEHRERQKPNIVLQINTKKDTGTEAGDPTSRIVTTIVRSPKKSQANLNDPIVNDLFTADPIQINKKAKAQVSPTIASSQTTSDGAPMNSDNSARKRPSSSNYTSKIDKPIGNESGDATTPKKKRKDSDSTPANGSSTPVSSRHIAQKIKESLEVRCEHMKDLEISHDQIEKLADEIEEQLNDCFKEGTSKYLTKFRSLLFNLRDSKNQGLVKNVLTGEITPSKLVRMSPDEMASHELAKWRERENKHSIELIKRDAQLIAQQVIVKKTHKGEEVISAPSINSPDDRTVVADNQEMPKTTTEQDTKRVDASRSVRNSPTAISSIGSGALKMKITGASHESFNKGREVPKISLIPSLPFLDTTKEHKNHVFDINCKICSKQQSADSPIREQDPISTNDEIDRKPNETDLSSSTDQPKRIRISIDTKLDPSNLSRMREPLIRPSESPINESDDYNIETSPNDMSSNQVGSEGDEDSYDPSDYLIMHKPSTSESTKQPTLSEPCWTGTINMPEIAKFSALAKPVSGPVEFMREEVNQNLIVCGRIAPDQVQSYIRKLRSTTKNQILAIQLFPLGPDDKLSFDSFFDYLYSRNRYGVIQAQALKDFYILPILEKGSVPDIVKPIKGPGIDRKDKNCLLGLLVRNKKSPASSNATSVSSSYTPTPLNKSTN